MAEENFDLALISCLENDLVPHLGNPRVPDYLIVQFGKILHQGSQLLEDSLPPSSTLGLVDEDDADGTNISLDVREFQKLDLESLGTTASVIPVLRERFSFWCFDLMFLICSDVMSGKSFVWYGSFL